MKRETRKRPRNKPAVSAAREAYAAVTAKPEDALLTRREVAAFVTHVLGRPLSYSSLAKLCAEGLGPAPSEWWGKLPLYTREAVKVWSDERATPARVFKKASAIA
jgi:hypothetical protein